MVHGLIVKYVVTLHFTSLEMFWQAGGNYQGICLKFL